MKRIHKNLRKVLAIVLVCAMLTMSMGAYSGDNKEKYEPINAMGASFSDSNTLSRNEFNIEPTFSQSLILSQTENDGEFLGSYTLNAFFGEETDTIQMDGIFTHKAMNDTVSGKFALLEKEVEINGVEYYMYADVSKDENSDKIFTSISLVPLNASGVSDYIFFSIGEPFVTIQMLNDLNNRGEEEMSVYGEPRMSNASNYSTTNDVDFSKYEEKESTTASIGSDTAAFIKMYHSQEYSTVAVTMVSNANELINEVEHSGYAMIRPMNLEFGLQRVGSSSLQISGVEDPGFNSDDSTSVYVANYLSLVSGILGVWYKTPAVISNFISFLSSSIDGGEITGTDKDYTNNFSYLIDINNSYFWDFDDEVMTIVFGLGNDGTASFKAYGQIKYQIQYIPVGSNYPSSYYLNSNEAYTESALIAQ
ncbi:MAG: hypothetical protein R3Y32_07025 [Bacillota bacterium]